MSDLDRPSSPPNLYTPRQPPDKSALGALLELPSLSIQSGTKPLDSNERLRVQLREAHSQVDQARMELEAIRQSVGYKFTGRVRNLFERLLPPTSRRGALHHALLNGFEIWMNDGLAKLAVRSASKLGRACGRSLGIGTEGRRVSNAVRRRALIRSIATDAATAGTRSPAARGLTEIDHILGRDCQRCSHFRESSCSLVTATTPEAACASFQELLLNRAAACPAGIWPGRESPPLTRRNLVYYIFPVRHPEQVWQWNVAELLKRLAVFNGRRIITVATVPGGALGNGRFVDPPEAVVEAFAGHDVEFRFVANDARGQEAPHFLAAMREVASIDPTEAVFYAHAKGVTRPIRGGEAIRDWTAAMYHHNLDRIDEVSDLLRRWPCLGIAKKYGYPEMFVAGRARRDWGEGNRPWHGWHYAGTFWWARHDTLFSRPDWDQIELFAYATEKYLANFFRADEAYCLAYDDCVRPYAAATWRTESEPTRLTDSQVPVRQRKAA